MGNYEKLNLWHKALDLAVDIYRITSENTGFQKDFSLRDQIRRASVSISSSIAEGDKLGSDRQAVRHFYIANGSSAELYSQLMIAQRTGYLTVHEGVSILRECRFISSMLMSLNRARR